jgi:hypothetical protein
MLGRNDDGRVEGSLCADCREGVLSREWRGMSSQQITRLDHLERIQRASDARQRLQEEVVGFCAG